jgi:hypothetical protein
MKEVVVALEDEKSIANLSAEDITARKVLIDKFLKLPSEVFTKLRYFQPQVGCLNKCSFCSQSAGQKIWQFTKSGIRNIVAAIKFVAVIKAPDSYLQNKEVFSKEGVFEKDFKMPKYGLVSYQRNYKPGVVYPYLDNDPSLYPYLDTFLEISWKDLGVKTRLTTVGYSRKNSLLQKMHERINSKLTDTISKIVLSYSQYPFGWRTSQKEYILDCENFLKTYKSSVMRRGRGFLSVEFKFKPLVKVADTQVYKINRRQVLHSGPYLLISLHEDPDVTPTKLKEIRGHSVILDRRPEKYLMIASDKLVDEKRWLNVANIIITKNMLCKEDVQKFINIPCLIREVNFYVMKNEDGIYYAIDPEIRDNGFFAKQFYPKTKRKNSGYIDSERYFLNTLIAYKKSKGLDRTSEFLEATWEDVDAVIENIKLEAIHYKSIIAEVEEYIIKEVLPLVEGYVKYLRNSGYPPSYFFDKEFTIDTGIICNLGRATYEFKGLASREDLPLTPQEERAFGVISSLSQDGKVWRISPVPFIQNDEEATVSMIGKDNIASKKQLLSIQEMNLSKRSVPEEYITKQFYIELPPNSIELLQLSAEKVWIPGSIPIE